MGFRINTNIGAMNAHRNAINTNKNLENSLQRLSSGLRINKAADDASGMAIADSLRSQAMGLGQAIRNANDGIGVVQTADGALDEYINIINTVRTKAIQAASDGQNDDSRMAIQRDINRLLEEADNIAKTTSFNGLNLLDGSYTDKKFQIGAYANETVSISIANTRTTAVGQFAYDTGTTVDSSSAWSGTDYVTINGVDIQSGATAKERADAINNASGLNVTATAQTTVKGAASIAGGSIQSGDIYINKVDLGDVTFSAGDSTSTLVTAINKISDQTGVKATVENGALVLTAEDGRNVVLSGDAAQSTGAAVADLQAMGIGSVYLNGSSTATAIDTDNSGGSGGGADGIADAVATLVGALTLESDSSITIAGTGSFTDFGI